MTIQAWGSAAALVAASLLIGHALRTLGLRCRAAAPAVGLAALIVISAVVIKLPGRDVTAAAVLLAVVLVAAAIVVRDLVIRHRTSQGALWRPTEAWLVAPTTLLLAVLGAAIPFVANGHVGLPGVSLDNDTANHMVWAEALRSPAVGVRYGVPTGYPLGPHSLADALSTGLGVRLDLAFTGLLIATVLITALVAAGALGGDAAWKRPVVGVMAALLYLPAAYYAEASFKETLMGVLLLAAVLHLEGLRAAWTARARRRWLGLLPLSILFAAAVYTYSYPAVAWFGLTLVIWLAAEIVMRPRWLRLWRVRLRDLAPPALIGAAVAVVLVLPTIGRIASFAGTVGLSPAAAGAITTSNLGNLPYALSPYEALGLWNSPDFRIRPVSEFHAGELALAALAVLVFGLLWCIRRREVILPAAVAACAIVYWRASHGQSPYVSAKALAIAGPVVAVTGCRGLLAAAPLGRFVTPVRYLAAAAFVGFALHSSYLALRDEPVWAPESTRELVSLARYTRGAPVLFLGASDYADWIFHASDMSALAPNSVSMAQAAPSPTKPNTYGTPLDFDSVDPATVNRFGWFVTTTTAYASAPPAGVTLVRRLPMYELWRRTGTIAPRRSLEPAGQPGAVLNCRTKAGRALSRGAGEAAIMTRPVTAGLSAVQPGNADTTTLRLAAGTWDLSLQYLSPLALEVTIGGRRWRMPAYDDRPGPFFHIGTVVSTGQPVYVTVREIRSSAIAGPVLAALLTQVAAVRSPDPRRLVPLAHACGRYVDWYRTAP